jgi:hypothetical protein
MKHFQLVLYSSAAVAYALGVLLHLPYGGEHIYSDIVTVFQERECGSGVCPGVLPVPYVQTFMEYPVITAMFMYVMGVLGGHFAGNLITNYYWFTAVFLAYPTFLMIREMLKIAEARRVPRARLLWYLVITPSFVFLVMLNWYIIGVFFAVAGLRKYTQGRLALGGVLFGLSAASNLITAVPAIGLIIASKTSKDRLTFAASALVVYSAVNLPFIVLNEKLWVAAFNWTYNWYVENSWILLLSSDVYTPIRHIIPPIAFTAFVAWMLWLRYRRGLTDPVVFAFLAMFGYVFSTYIYTPQMNLMLLPFFVLLPVAGYYWEFLAFDAANSMIIVLGFSQPLVGLGITLSFSVFNRLSLFWWIAVIRSLWVGKFAVFNRIPGLRIRTPKPRESKDSPRPPRSEEEG